MTDTADHFKTVSELLATRCPFVIATVVRVTGSTPQDAGAKMIVDISGRCHGTVGGGRVEHRAIEHAREMLGDPNRRREIVDWNLQRDIGMTCGGLMQFYFEAHHHQQWHIVVFGAGHVAQALIRLLTSLDCRITCLDDRQQWIDRLENHWRLTTRCVENLAQQVDTLDGSEFVLCMTQGHATDRPVLSAIFQRGMTLPYLGVIGSKSKRGVLVRELTEDGIARETAEQFHCPIGLSIGSNQPAEIAISIAAELIRERDAARQEW